MPSPVGHLLAGVAIGWAVEPLTEPAPRPRPVRESWRPWSRFVLLCAALAALPDLDLIYPPIHRRVTHGVGAVLLILIIAAAVTGWVTRKSAWRMALACGLAYGSHILLDLLGRDLSPPYGIRALWPFSDAWFISGWDLFPGTQRRNVFSTASMLANLRAAVQETAILGPFTVLAWWIRRRRAAFSIDKSPDPTCGRADPPPPSA